MKYKREYLLKIYERKDLTMWTKLEVYNEDHYLGYIYTNETERKEIINEITKEFGVKWTRYNIGN